MENMENLVHRMMLLKKSILRTICPKKSTKILAGAMAVEIDVGAVEIDVEAVEDIVEAEVAATVEETVVVVDVATNSQILTKIRFG
ncbi:MAG: hypothetical protein BAJATHORv1_40350 [Candidatus Thorarchaeota archaeon]|nr:MAG: hypothetical protein BAJATHORv1_40350 [Candidatus Thorarchaeota archaeon]